MPAAEQQNVGPPSSQKSERHRELAAIHMRLAELKALGAMDEDGYRALLKREFGVESSAALDRADRIALLNLLKGKPDTLYRHRRRYWGRQGLRAGMATAEQLAMIEDLAERVFRSPDKPKALRTFLAKRFGVSDLRFLETEKASKALNALKAMERRGR